MKLLLILFILIFLILSSCSVAKNSEKQNCENMVRYVLVNYKVIDSNTSLELEQRNFVSSDLPYPKPEEGVNSGINPFVSYSFKYDLDTREKYLVENRLYSTSWIGPIKNTPADYKCGPWRD